MLQFTRPLLFSRMRRVPRSYEHDLSAQMESLSLQAKPNRSLLLIHIQAFHTTRSLLKDKAHLTPEGYIKETLLRDRRAFLQEHNLLNDRIVFQDHNVYENFHLYDIGEIDQNGVSNLERILKGLAPLTIGGTDYLTIHHFDQTHAGDWIILPNQFHCENDRELHSNVKVRRSVIRHQFSIERVAYWQHVAQRYLDKKDTSLRKKR